MESFKLQVEHTHTQLTSLACQVMRLMWVSIYRQLNVTALDTGIHRLKAVIVCINIALEDY